MVMLNARSMEKSCSHSMEKWSQVGMCLHPPNTDFMAYVYSGTVKYGRLCQLCYYQLVLLNAFCTTFMLCDIDVLSHVHTVSVFLKRLHPAAVNLESQ